jgi:hypothetical protein
MKKILLACSIISGLVGFVIPAQASVEISESTIRIIATRACRAWQNSDVTERELYNKIYATVEQNSDSPQQGHNVYLQYRQQYFEKVSKTIVQNTIEQCTKSKS